MTVAAANGPFLAAIAIVGLVPERSEDLVQNFFQSGVKQNLRFLHVDLECLIQKMIEIEFDPDKGEVRLNVEQAKPAAPVDYATFAIDVEALARLEIFAILFSSSVRVFR